jgi:hypothetical protein
MRRAHLLAILLALLAPSRPAGAQAGPAEDSGVAPTLRIGGFSDINFFTTDEDDKTPTSGFQEGQFVLHFSSALSSRLSFFAELSLTARSTEFRTEVERTILRYDHSDKLKISGGRYHTPANWWNTAFHHGLWLQTSTARPEMIQFGGEFIPVHFVGALAEGSVPVAGMSLRYQGGIGNGRGSVLSRGGDSGDVNDSRAWLFNLSARPDRLLKLDFGVSGYFDRLTLVASEEDFDERILSAFVAYSGETPEVIAEYAHTRHEDRDTAADYDASAGYVQLAYRLPWSNARFKPYARIERMEVDADDPVYASLNDRRVGIAGLRFDFSNWAAIKGEYRRTRSNEDPYVNAFFSQVCFAF